MHSNDRGVTTFDVDSYLKGSGPERAQVWSPPSGKAPRERVSSAITPEPGSRWKIFADRYGNHLGTTICAGSSPTSG